MAGDDPVQELQSRLLEEQREFMRVTLLRVERIARDQWGELSRMNDELSRNTDVLSRELSRMNDELERQGREGRAEARAGREALARVLDRLNRLDPPPAAA